MRLINGYQVSQAIHVATVLGIADLLKNGSRTASELAKATDTHPSSLYRVLRALASVGVFKEGSGKRFDLTPMGKCLQSGADNPVGAWAMFIGHPIWEAWGDLLYSVKTGKSAFKHVHSVDVWKYRKLHPEAGKTFDRTMTANARRTAVAVATSYDFGKFKRVVDVGGGHGALLAEILKRHRSVCGVLFDQPHVVANAKKALQDAGVSGRCRTIGGDFFVEVPADGDVYILEHILNDWDDARARAVLRTCRRAFKKDTRLLVATHLVASPNEGPDVKFRDLHMLVSPGGRKRTRGEYKALLNASGFTLLSVVRSGHEVSLLEARPV